MRVSDGFPIKAEPRNDEERYIVEEAKKHLDETILSSHWVMSEHVENVVRLGKKNIDFLMKMMRENNHPQGMYSHFLIDVVMELYKDDLRIEGFLGVDGCVKALLSLYDQGVLKVLDENPQKVLEIRPGEKISVAERAESGDKMEMSCKGLFGKKIPLGK